MKIYKSLFLLLVLLTGVSCNQSSKEQNSKTAEVSELSKVPEIKKVALNIEGMTCEIGCARTIQSKLSKKKGVTFAEVNFDKKEGIVEYDASKISKKQLVETVEKIAGGDTYKVTAVNEME